MKKESYIKTLYNKAIKRIENYFDISLHRDVHEFKPALVEIQDAPASPVGRFLIWFIASLIFISIVWSSLATIDIIAMAQGKVIPIGNTKVIQAHSDGTISNIYIREGSYVKKGDLLIKIDEDSYKAEQQSLEKSYAAELAKNRRSKAMLDYIENGTVLKPDFSDIKTINAKVQNLLFDEEYRDLESSLGILRETLKEKQHEFDSAVDNIKQYTQVLKIITENEKRMKTLMERDMVSVMEYLEYKEKQIREQNNLNTYASKEKQLKANIAEIQQRLDATLIDKKKTQLLAFEDSFNNMNKLGEEIKKNQVLLNYSNITAPVSGYVQELKFHTIGGVVEQAQEILKIVEDKSDIEVEVMVPSKDIGFIEKGSLVAIKLDAFPFTKYGLVHGQVSNISEDAITDEKLGLVYKTKISLDQKYIQIEDKKVNLTYGMGLTAEIKTGQRTVLEYFLSPVIKHVDESIRER